MTALVCALAISTAFAAQDPVQIAARMSDQAFALLDTLNVTHGRDNPSPMLGPIGGFAADSQALVRALKAGDRSATADALAQLQSDRQAVDRAEPSDAAHFDAGRWKAIKHELDSLTALAPAESPARATPSLGAGSANGSGGDLSVTVEKVRLEPDDTLHVNGTIKGRDISSAGIYRAGRRIARLGVTPDRHEQRIALDLHIRDAQPGTVIRVYDSNGHSAQAAIPMPYAEQGRAGGETEEIPRRASLPPRHRPGGLGSSNIRVTINNCELVDPASREYQLSGRIAGLNLARAGIYVDGNLARRIPLKSGRGYQVTRFATHFELRGAQASLRVYGQGSDFTETPLALGPVTVPYAASPYGVNPYTANPYVGNPYGASPYVASPRISVQITQVQQVAPGLTVVNGVIVGRNVVSAGIYQNGALIQPINVGAIGGGIGGLISNLLPGTTRQIAFSGRFNPARGVAVVRAVDASGAVAQQPVFGGGTPYRPAPYGYGIVPPLEGGGLAPYVGRGPAPSGSSLPW